MTFGSRGEAPFAVYNMQLADSVDYRQITMTPRQTPQGRYRASVGPRPMGGLTQDGRIYQMKVPLREQGQNVGRHGQSSSLKAGVRGPVGLA